MSNYDLLTNEKNKELYKKYYGCIFSELAESQQKELLNNGFNIWLESGNDADGCIIDFNCGLSAAGLILSNEIEVIYLVNENTRLYDSQLGIIE